MDAVTVTTLSTATTEEPVFSPAAECAARWQKHLESRIRVTPWTTTRMSGIGDACERRIVYRRTEGHHEKPHDAGLQAIFDLGHHLEVYAVRKLEAMGYEVKQRGRDWADPDLDMTGHVDILLGHEKWPVDVVTEVKGLNEFTAGTIEALADIRDHHSAWVRKYFWQLQGYLYVERKPLGMFALLGKSSGQFTFVDCPRDDRFIETELLPRARRVRDHVRAKTLPARITTSDECQRCGFQHLCCPDIVYGDAPVILANPELEKLLDQRAAVEAAGREFVRLDKRVKDMLPDAPLVIVGDHEISAKKGERAGYTVKPTTSWTRKIGRLGRSGGVH